MSDVSTKQVLAACVAVAMVAGFTIDLYAAVPQMTADRFGLELDQASMWIAFTGLGWALGQFFSGLLLDFGVRKGLSLAISGCVLLTFLAFFAPTFEIGLSLRLLSGMSAGVSFAAVRIYLRQISVDEGLGQMMSIFSMSFLLGILLAPVAGLGMFFLFGFWGVVGLHAFLCVVAIGFCVFLPSQTILCQAPPTLERRGRELPTWVAQSVQGSTSFLGGVSMALMPIMLVEVFSHSFYLPFITVPGILFGVFLARVNHKLLNTQRLIDVMTFSLLAALLVFWAALVVGYFSSVWIGFALALMIGFSFFATAGSNAESISLSRPANSYSALARRRAIPVTVGNLGFVLVSALAGSWGVDSIGVWPHVFAASLLTILILIFHTPRWVSRMEKALI